ncbi:MAG: PQQ-binding-like beta-propeller repeat protein, partial [Lentisphaeria bacterium]|nr:PQQ-binding-like beta-propeller repeat protein [Lentisphaeria bacterium]
QTYVAKDRKSGEKLWSVQPWEEELEVEDKRRYRRSVTITEVFSKSILFRRPYCGILVCVEMATGRVQWRFDVLVGKLAAVQGAEKELVVTDEVGLEYHLSAENGDLLKVVVTEKAKPSFFRRGFAARTPVKRKVRDAPAPRDMGATVMDHSLPMPKRLQALYRIKSAEDCSVRELKSFVLGRKCPHAMREHLIMKLMEIQPGRSVEELFGADSAARRDLQALFARAVVKLGRADDVDYVIPFLHGDGTEAGKRNAQGYVFWMGMKMPDEVLGILRPVWERMADARDQKIACLKSLATGGHMAQFQSLFQEMDRKVLFGDSILRMYLAAAGDEEAMDRTIRKAKRDGSKFYRGREMDLLLKACSDFGLPKRLFPILVDAMEDRPTYINKKSIALLGECDHPDTLKVLQTLYCRVWSGARTPALIRAIEDQTGKCIQEVERSFGGLNLPKVIHFVPRK